MLTLYRIHTKRCSARRDRLDRAYRKCNCPIHVEGKCGDEFVRKGLQTSNWQRAQQRVMEAEARASWEPLPDDKSAQLITIADARAKFLKDAESGRRLGESTLKKYRLMLKHLEQFASNKGFVYLKQLDSDALRDFRDTWQL